MVRTAAIAAVLVFLGAAAFAEPASELLTISHQATDRTALVHRPTSAPPGPLPLVIALHGLGGTGAQFHFAGFDAVADREGFAVAYPDAIANQDNVSKHPRVYIDGNGGLGISRIQDLAAAGDVEKIGFQCYPVWTKGRRDTMTTCANKAAQAHDIDVIYPGVTGAWMVLQAFSFTDECGSDPTCAGPPLEETGPYPTYSQQCKMRDRSTPDATHIMWFDALFMTNNNFHGRLGNISRAAADPNCD